MDPIRKAYRGALWEVYARAVSLLSVLGLMACFVLGGSDLLQWACPTFTLNASLTEKYQSNEAYTKFETLKRNLPPEEITRERLIDYEKLLRIERLDARQNLVKVVLGLTIIALMNVVLAKTYRRKEN